MRYLAKDRIFFLKGSTNFLGLSSIKKAARKIKHSFEKQNNIIEANKFYALLLIYFTDYEIFKVIIIVSLDNEYIINETIKKIYPL